MTPTENNNLEQERDGVIRSSAWLGRVDVSCGVQRIDDEHVLLRCGSDCIVTDNDGVTNILRALVDALETGSACPCDDRKYQSRESLLRHARSLASADESQPARLLASRRSPKRTESRFPFLHPPNVAHLFSVASYRGGPSGLTTQAHPQPESGVTKAKEANE